MHCYGVSEKHAFGTITMSSSSVDARTLHIMKDFTSHDACGMSHKAGKVGVHEYIVTMIFLIYFISFHNLLSYMIFRLWISSVVVGLIQSVSVRFCLHEQKTVNRIQLEKFDTHVNTVRNPARASSSRACSNRAANGMSLRRLHRKVAGLGLGYLAIGTQMSETTAGSSSTGAHRQELGREHGGLLRRDMDRGAESLRHDEGRIQGRRRVHWGLCQVYRLVPQCDHGSQEPAEGEETEKSGDSQPDVDSNSDGDRISNSPSGSGEFECCSASPLPDVACNDDDLGGQGLGSGLGVCYSDSDTDRDPDRGWGPYQSDPVWETDHLRPEAGELQEEVAGRSLDELAALLAAASSANGTRGGHPTQLDA